MMIVGIYKFLKKTNLKVLIFDLLHLPEVQGLLISFGLSAILGLIVIGLVIWKMIL